MVFDEGASSLAPPTTTQEGSSLGGTFPPPPGGTNNPAADSYLDELPGIFNETEVEPPGGGVNGTENPAGDSHLSDLPQVFDDENTIDSQEENESSLSNRQERVLAFVPVISSALSMVGSALILRLLWRKRFYSVSNNLNSYGRFLGVMSLYDVISSATAALQSFLVPWDSRRLYGVGNQTTCNMLGFLFQFNNTSYWYFGALSVYFLSVIRFRVSEEKFARRIEPWLHVVCIGYPLITAIILVSLKKFGELDIGAGCYLVETETCGEGCYQLLSYVVALAPFVIVFATIVVCNVTIAWFVRKTLLASRGHQLSPDSTESRIRNVTIQAFLYVGVFLLTYVWTLILRLTENETDEEDPSAQEADLYHWMVLRAVFLPLMGLFNLLVYVRPRYLHRREHYANEGRLRSFGYVVCHAEGERAARDDRRVSLFSRPSSASSDSGGILRWFSPRRKNDSSSNKQGSGSLDVETAGNDGSSGSSKLAKGGSALKEQAHKFADLDIEEA